MSVPRAGSVSRQAQRPLIYALLAITVRQVSGLIHEANLQQRDLFSRQTDRLQSERSPVRFPGPD